jgi:hypothetical protein
MLWHRGITNTAYFTGNPPYSFWSYSHPARPASTKGCHAPWCSGVLIGKSIVSKILDFELRNAEKCSPEQMYAEQTEPPR